MEYKKKVTTLFVLIAVLVLTYTATLVFSPERTGTRAASYFWLDSRLAGRAARIVISMAGESTELVKKNNQWFVLNNGKEYPARQLRIEDFIDIFTERAAWPVRSSSAASHARLGLDSESASRITIYGENTTLLDILLGIEDSTGREIYLRKYGQNEVRSGDNTVISYLSGSANNWYNLRLIPESEDGRIAIDSVQRLSVYTDEAALIFTRRNREWTVSGLAVVNPDQNSIDSYVRSVLNAEGDDFNDTFNVDDHIFNFVRIVLELGTGGIKVIRLSEPDESGRCYANIEGSQYVYSIAPWQVQRLFRNTSDFERQ